MENPVKLEDLIKIDDLTKVKDLLSTIKDLSGVFESFISSAQKNADRYSQSIGEILKVTDNLEKSLTNLDSTRKEEQQIIAKEAAEVEKNVKAAEKYTIALKQTQDQISILTQQQEKLVSAKKKLESANVAETGSVNTLKKQLDESIKSYNNLGDATSKAVKETAISRIKELSKQVAASENAVKQVKKSVDLAAGSYNELSFRVNEAKKKLRDMEGGLQSNSKEFKNLQKFVKQGTEQLAAFDKKAGVNNFNTLAGDLGAIHPALGRVAGGFEQVSQAALKLIANPVVAILAAIAAAVILITKSVQTYFSESIEGQDKLSEVSARFIGIQEAMNDEFQKIGKSAIEAMENPKQAIKDLGNFLIENIENRFKALLNFLPAVGIAIKEALTGGDVEGALKKLGDNYFQFFTGVAGISQKASDFIDKANKKTELALKLSALEDAIRKERIIDVVDDAVTELQVAEDLEKSKNKLRFSDEQRYRALKEANALLLDQMRGDVQLAQAEIDSQRQLIRLKGYDIKQNESALDLLKNETALSHVKYEVLEKLAALEAAQLKIQENASIKRKALLKQEIAFVKEEAKERSDALKAQEQSQLDLFNAISQGRIEIAKQTLASENATLNERIDALDDILIEEQEIAERARDKEIQAAREAALERIELTVAQNEAVNNNTKLSLEERISLDRKYREENLEESQASDKVFINQLDKTAKDFDTKIKQLEAANVAAVKDNVFKSLQKDFQQLSDKISTAGSNELTELDEAYKQGNVSLQRTLFLRGEIQDEDRISQLNAQLDYYEKQKDVLESYGLDVTNIDRQIANVRQQLSQESTDKMIEDQERLQEAVNQIGGELVNTYDAFLTARVERNLEALEQQLADEDFKKEGSLRIAGDDAQAKALIEQNFAIKQKEIQREQAKEKRKLAVFDKARSAAEIGINTAKGISTAVAASPLTFGLPWSAFVAVTGALQLAQVLATPIPAFAKGTMSSPEGMALIGEAGRELRINPSGDISVVDRPQVAYLERGTKIIPNTPTEQLLQDAERFGDGFMVDHLTNSYGKNANALQVAKNSLDTYKLVQALAQNGKDITDAIKSQPRDLYDERGYRSYQQNVNLRIERLNKRHNLGS
jgi:hypothetical protein